MPPGSKGALRRSLPSVRYEEWGATMSSSDFSEARLEQFIGSGCTGPGPAFDTVAAIWTVHDRVERTSQTGDASGGMSRIRCCSPRASASSSRSTAVASCRRGPKHWTEPRPSSRPGPGGGRGRRARHFPAKPARPSRLRHVHVGVHTRGPVAARREALGAQAGEAAIRSVFERAGFTRSTPTAASTCSTPG